MVARPILASLALAACSAAAPPVVAPDMTPELAGSWWAIETIDGRALETQQAGQQKPYIAFVERSYNAYAGCNGMGGLYAQRGARIYTMPGPQTQMGCAGRLGWQEAAVNAVMYASPTVSGSGERMTLRAKGRTIVIRRMGPPRRLNEPPEAWQGTRLAGQSFELSRIDGDPLNRTPLPKVSFGQNTATVSGLAGESTRLRYRQTASTVTFGGGRRERLGSFFEGAALDVVSGPNGEILLAGDGHWLAGHNVRRDRPK